MQRQENLILWWSCSPFLQEIETRFNTQWVQSPLSNQGNSLSLISTCKKTFLSSLLLCQSSFLEFEETEKLSFWWRNICWRLKNHTLYEPCGGLPLEVTESNLASPQIPEPILAGQALREWATFMVGFEASLASHVHLTSLVGSSHLEWRSSRSHQRKFTFQSGILCKQEYCYLDVYVMWCPSGGH